MRQTSYLRKRYRAILAYTGLVLFICAFLMLVPAVTAWAWDENAENLKAFLISAITMGGSGLVSWLFLRQKQTEEAGLSLQEGGVIVLLSWVGVCLFSSWPFIAINHLTLTQAVFEAVSGWTTTGLSVIDVTKAARSILLWRSLMQLAGGAGLAIIMLSAITGSSGPALPAAEGREQLVPHVRQSAKLVMLIYSGYVIIGIGLLWFAGMNWFDAVNHAFAALSTGGFSTRATSIGHWDSVTVEAVTLPLMILGNLSFVTAWMFLRGRFRVAGRNGELRLTALIIPLAASLLFMLTVRDLYPTLGKSVRVAVFETVTALTTTGFSTVDYQSWNGFGWLALLLLMLVGGGACSTAGGIKQYRIYLLYKSLVWELKRSLLPRTAVVENFVWAGEQRVFVNDTRLRQIGTFLFLYLLALAIGTAILTACGYGLKHSLFEYASTIGTVGLSSGITSVETPAIALWAQTFGMLLGRLEFLVIFSSLAKITHDVPLICRTDN